jgi:hypothetical protein
LAVRFNKIRLDWVGSEKLPFNLKKISFLFYFLFSVVQPQSPRKKNRLSLHLNTERQRETERDRERQRETERQRGTETQRHRETERQRDTEIQRDRDTERHRETQRDRETERQRDRDVETDSNFLIYKVVIYKLASYRKFRWT